MTKPHPSAMKPHRTLIAALLLATAGFAASGLARAMPPGAPSGGTIQGEVLEVKDVDAYTYLRLKTAQGETWAAVTKAAVKTGSQVSIANPMVMRNFESKSLKKTFDSIVFGTIAGANVPSTATGALPGASPHGAGMAAPAKATAPAAPIKLAKAVGADARTVAEVVDGKAALKGKPVLVHGQVVKVSNGIMGKNWVHLQDGSGSATARSNDILVTTKDTVAIGDVVHARGTVRTDVDLGSGYNYAVLIEDASLKK